MRDKISNWIAPIFSNCGKDLGLLILRVWFGGLMLTHGLDKVMNFAERSTQFFDPIGLGAKTSFMLMSITEFGAALFIILGLFTRLASIPLVIGMTVAAFFTFPLFALGTSELALLYLGAFIVLLIAGGGKYSADHYLGKYFVRKEQRELRYHKR